MSSMFGMADSVCLGGGIGHAYLRASQGRAILSICSTAESAVLNSVGRPETDIDQDGNENGARL